MRISAPLNNDPLPSLQWIEVASSLQIPSFHIVGLPSPEVAEARERIRAAIEASGLEFPRRRVVVNLSPASIKKRGTGLDLAMALAILASARRTPLPESCFLAWGELGLDGCVKPARQLTRALHAAWKEGVPYVFLSSEERKEARRAQMLVKTAAQFDRQPPALVFVENLADAWSKLDAIACDEAFRVAEAEEATPAPARRDPLALLPLSPLLERSVSIAAIGNHHLLLLGPRGSGKSHALEWLIELQPPISSRLQLERALLAEINRSASSCEEDPDDFASVVPVRRISPQARPSALIGNANSAGVRPGELSLAHGGLLVADEFPEWPRDTREILREPLERGHVLLTRTEGSVELPARFTLAANGNLCPCGGWPSQFPRPIEAQLHAIELPRCSCSPARRLSYLQRLSGPIIDRIDMVALVAAAPLQPEPETGNSKQKKGRKGTQDLMSNLRERIVRARELAISRWGSAPGQLPPSQLEELLSENPAWVDRIQRSFVTSLRSRHKILRLALTLSCLDDKPAPMDHHFAEALCYRPERFGFSDQ